LTTGYAAIDQICDYYTTLPNRPVKSDVEPGYLIKQLPSEFEFCSCGCM
jgi:aromatic-L-amino-acid decarboxylase